MRAAQQAPRCGQRVSTQPRDSTRDRSLFLFARFLLTLFRFLLTLLRFPAEGRFDSRAFLCFSFAGFHGCPFFGRFPGGGFRLFMFSPFDGFSPNPFRDFHPPG
jgi:hypothetical protein